MIAQSVRQCLTNCVTHASRADKAIANYMLAHLNTLAFETAAGVGSKVHVSEATVGRFCRSVGYRSFKDLKDHLKRDLGDKPWLISDRLRYFLEHSQTGEVQLARGLQLEMAGLLTVYELAQTVEWQKVVKRLAKTPAVFVSGFQNERGMARIFVDQLNNLRERVHLLDLVSEHLPELLVSETDKSCLVIFVAGTYSYPARWLAMEAKQANIPVTLITDAYCDWGKELVDETFVVPTDFNLLLKSNAQMACLANLLVNGIFIELGPAGETRMNEIARLKSRFTGRDGDSSEHSARDRKINHIEHLD